MEIELRIHHVSGVKMLNVAFKSQPPHLHGPLVSLTSMTVSHLTQILLQSGEITAALCSREDNYSVKDCIT